MPTNLRSRETTVLGAAGTMGTNREMVTGLFRSRDDAEQAYGSLTGRGYTRDDVNITMSDEARRLHFGDATPDSELGDRALLGMGIPEDRAVYYQAGINEGGIILGVCPRSEEDARYFEREWQRARGEQVIH